MRRNTCRHLNAQIGFVAKILLVVRDLWLSLNLGIRAIVESNTASDKLPTYLSTVGIEAKQPSVKEIIERQFQLENKKGKRNENK